MHSKPTIVLLIINMLLLVHAVLALPLSADPQVLFIPEALSIPEAPQSADSETETSSSTTKTGDASVSESKSSACEPCTNISTDSEMEKLAADNLANKNQLYPFSALAEVIHSHRRKRDTGTLDELHRNVCNQIRDIALQTVPGASETPCPWTYDCTYYPNMLPHYILEARCLNTTCQYPSCSQDTQGIPPPPSGKHCVGYNTTYSVLDFPLNGSASRPFSVRIGCNCEA